MPQVVQLFRETAFDPQTVEVMYEAYDKVRKSLHLAGQPDIENETIAMQIIALARNGERDRDRLWAIALSALGDGAVLGK